LGGQEISNAIIRLADQGASGQTIFAGGAEAHIALESEVVDYFCGFERQVNAMIFDVDLRENVIEMRRGRFCNGA
jgi:hypothetical protein